MEARCRVELLGGLRVLQNDRIVNRFSTRKTGVLLAYLACYRQHPHPREALVEMLWPGAALAAGRASLSVALSSLRHQLEPPGTLAGSIILADRLSVELNSAAVATDVTEFETLLRGAAAADSQAQRLQQLSDAIDLYRGLLLPGY